MFAGTVRRSSDLISSWWAASGVASIPVSRAGTRWPGLRPWVDRNWRTSVTSRIRDSISASATGSLNRKSGHAAIMTESSPVRAHHSSSVTNGITG